MISLFPHILCLGCVSLIFLGSGKHSRRIGAKTRKNRKNSGNFSAHSRSSNTTAHVKKEAKAKQKSEVWHGSRVSLTLPVSRCLGPKISIWNYSRATRASVFADTVTPDNLISYLIKLFSNYLLKRVKRCYMLLSY